MKATRRVNDTMTKRAAILHNRSPPRQQIHPRRLRIIHLRSHPSSRHDKRHPRRLNIPSTGQGDCHELVTTRLSPNTYQQNLSHWRKSARHRSLTGRKLNDPVSYTHLRAHETRHDLV